MDIFHQPNHIEMKNKTLDFYKSLQNKKSLCNVTARRSQWISLCSFTSFRNFFLLPPSHGFVSDIPAGLMQLFSYMLETRATQKGKGAQNPAE